jgi:MFS family permease
MTSSEYNKLIEGEKVNYVVYSSRWLQLSVFSLFTLTNGMAWLLYSGNSILMQSYYNVNEFGINILSMLYMIIYILGSNYANNVLVKQGIRKGLVYSAVLQLSGGIIRVLPWPFINPASLPLLSYFLGLVGQFFLAMAQLFLLSTPVTLASNWFPNNERVLATAIATVFNSIGQFIAFALNLICLGNYNNFALDNQGEFDIRAAPVPLLIISQAIFCVLSSALVLLFFRAKPPTPPSKSAELENLQENSIDSTDNYSWRAELKLLYNNRDYCILFALYAVSMGIAWTWATILNSLLTALNFNSSVAISAGMIFITAGILSGALFGYIADKTHKFSPLISLSLWGSLIGIIAFCAVPWANLGAAFILTFSGLLGFFLNSCIAIMLDLAVELSFPAVSANFSVQLLQAAANFLSLILTISASFLPNSLQFLAIFIFSALCAANLMLWAKFQGKSKRLHFEKNESLLNGAGGASTEPNIINSTAK